MCESVKKYAAEFAEEYKTEDKIETVKNLMTNMKWTLEQTLTNMGVSDKERSIITQQLQKQAITKVAAGHISVTAAFFIFSK